MGLFGAKQDTINKNVLVLVRTLIEMNKNKIKDDKEVTRKYYDLDADGDRDRESVLFLKDLKNRIKNDSNFNNIISLAPVRRYFKS